MNETNRFGIRIIGERINPGFMSTRAMFEDKDLGAIQALALKQVEAGAFALVVEGMRETLSTEKLADRIARMVSDLEKAADRGR